MLSGFLHLFSKDEPLPDIKRRFQHEYFIHGEYNSILKKNGFIKIEDCISENRLKVLEDAYRKLSTFPTYTITDKFQNSGRFRSPEIRNFVMESIGTFSKEFLPEIFDINVFESETTGAFQIKPPSQKSDLNPHQDSPVTDELIHNSIYVWIPLCDITEKNGPVWVLPGSHLWGNHQRSLNVHWVFEKHTKLLWKYMQPVLMKKGDILCWDTALIHGSTPNQSADTRVAITTTVLPKNYTMVDYFADEKTRKGYVEKYEVYRSFWENEDIMKRPACPPNKFSGLEQKVFPAAISKMALNQLILKNKPQ
jgi:hypothetical protein